MPVVLNNFVNGSIYGHTHGSICHQRIYIYNAQTSRPMEKEKSKEITWKLLYV
jgi:hypothetical protein